MINVPDIATLRAGTSVSDPAAVVFRYGPGLEGGGGVFVYDSSDTTSPDDYGTVIVDQAGHRWKRLYNSPLDIRWFGADASGVAPSDAALQNAVSVAKGRAIYAPKGDYVINKAITSTDPVHLYGDGHEQGPGGAETGTQCTRFLINYPGDFIDVSTIYPCIFRDFQIQAKTDGGYVRGTSYYGIKLTGLKAGGVIATGSFDVIDNVAFCNLNNGIYSLRPSLMMISHCYFLSWVRYAIEFETSLNIEGSPGFIQNCNFFNDIKDPILADTAIHSACGYMNVFNNWFDGAAFAVQFVPYNKPAGPVRIWKNHFETQQQWSVRVAYGNAETDLLEIDENEFLTDHDANGFVVIEDTSDHKTWISSLSVSRNEARFVSASDSSMKFFWLQTGQQGQVIGNRLRVEGGAQPIGIQVTGVTSNTQIEPPWQIYDNSFHGTFSSRYAVSDASQIRDDEGGTFAELPPVCANGSRFFVTDGAASGWHAAVTGSGTGVTAQLINGSWRAV